MVWFFNIHPIIIIIVIVSSSSSSSSKCILIDNLLFVCISCTYTGVIEIHSTTLRACSVHTNTINMGPWMPNQSFSPVCFGSRKIQEKHIPLTRKVYIYKSLFVLFTLMY